LQTGEPYLIFSDTVNRAMPASISASWALRVRQSNLCSEIMLHSGPDHRRRTHGGLLSFVRQTPRSSSSGANIRPSSRIVMRFLDNVLQDFIDRAPAEMAPAAYSAASGSDRLDWG
jgi:ribonucleoside-diphosphate reductase alpha chain